MQFFSPRWNKPRSYYYSRNTKMAPRVQGGGGGAIGEQKRGKGLSTDVDAGGGDAAVAVMRSHDADMGTSSDRVRRDSFTRLRVAGAGCRVDRD